MSTTTKGANRVDSEPNFERPGRDAITEANWPECQAQGFVFLENQTDPHDETNVSRIEAAENFFGRRNVFTGHAYDLKEQRPLAHMPGLGIYIGPEGDRELAESFSAMWREKEQRQH